MADASTYGWRGGPRFPGDTASGIDYQSGAPTAADVPPELPPELVPPRRPSPRSPVPSMLPIPMTPVAPRELPRAAQAPSRAPSSPMGDLSDLINMAQGASDLLGPKQDQPAGPYKSDAAKPSSPPPLQPSNQFEKVTAQPMTDLSYPPGAGQPPALPQASPYARSAGAAPPESRAQGQGGSLDAYREQARRMLPRIAIIESGGDPKAVGAAGERTQYQIMPSTAAKPGYGVAPLQDFNDWRDVDRFATDLLAKYLQLSNGNERMAAAAWNGGGTMIRRMQEGDVLPPGVDQYLQRFDATPAHGWQGHPMQRPASPTFQPSTDERMPSSYPAGGQGLDMNLMQALNQYFQLLQGQYGGTFT